MDTRDILSATDSTKRLIQDENYYKYIFKKTERIVSVVFYILHSIESNTKTKVHIEDLEHTARSVHDAVLQSLETRQYAAEDIVRSVAHALISLESKLNVAQVSGVVSPQIVSVLHNEVDSVLRGLNRYIGEENDQLTFEASPVRTPTQAPRVSKTAGSSEAKQRTVQTDHSDRRSRIKTILEAKGEATIKDISEIVSDISEKTIQRELNAMIEDNIIKRQGERRWSKYSLF